MSLREATSAKHTEAEQTALMQQMINGTITEKTYLKYLMQMVAVYEVLETVAMYNKLFDGMQSLQRKQHIMKDLFELKGQTEFSVLPATKKYTEYLQTLHSQPNKILAHMYVRHMGDLSGGQMLKDKLPGEGRWYTFEDVDDLKTKLRSKLTDKTDMIEEAIRAFDFNIAIFEEILDVGNDGDAKDADTKPVTTIL